MYRKSLVTGCIMAMLAVLFGAFGAHYLKTIFDTATLNSFETGVRYQFYHAFALLIFAFFAKENTRYANLIYGCFTAGIILFSGSIYALCVLKTTMHIGLGGIGILTPMGGLLFVVAWILFVLAALQKK